MALPNIGMNFTPYDTLTAAELDNLVENIEALADGTGLNDAVITQDKLATGADFATGWNVNALPAVTAVTNNGNRSYTLTHASSVASLVSEGMRRRFQRTVAANTYMGGLFNGSSHYFTKTSPSGTLGTVTNNFTIEAYVQPTSYATGFITGRLDATTANGFILRMESDGRAGVQVFNAGSGNFRAIATYQSLPLNKKTHVTASWTSGTVVIYFDGVSVPVAAAVTGGTAPTTAGTGGDFSIGRAGAYANYYFPGYISNVAVYDAVLSPATIREHAKGKLLGNEPNCIGAWSLDNTPNDQSAAGNNLTATGGVGFSNVSPFGNNGKSSTLEYGLTMSVSSDGLTEVVQVPEGCALPTAITSQDYSTQGNPFGFPKKPIAFWEARNQYTFQTTATPTIVDVTGLSIPYTATGTETIRLRFDPWYFTTTAGAGVGMFLYIRDGATTIVTKTFNGNGIGYSQTPTVIAEFNPTAGAHTFVASCSQNAAGTISLAGGVGAPSILTLEVL